jgi:hypothetical protein
MEKFTHTKGKWSCKPAEEYTDCYFVKATPSNPVFGECMHNARLIEKAPELLEAVINLQKRLEFLINLTPSGVERNAMTDENMVAMELIYACTHPIPEIE